MVLGDHAFSDSIRLGDVVFPVSLKGIPVR